MKDEDELKWCDDDCKNCDDDSIIKEIHAIRKEHAKRFNYDIKAMGDDHKLKHPIIVEMMTASRKGDHETVRKLRQKLNSM